MISAKEAHNKSREAIVKKYIYNVEAEIKEAVEDGRHSMKIFYEADFVESDTFKVMVELIQDNGYEVRTEPKDADGYIKMKVDWSKA